MNWPLYWTVAAVGATVAVAAIVRLVLRRPRRPYDGADWGGVDAGASHHGGDHDGGGGHH